MNKSILLIMIQSVVCIVIAVFLIQWVNTETEYKLWVLLSTILGLFLVAAPNLWFMLRGNDSINELWRKRYYNILVAVLCIALVSTRIAWVRMLISSVWLGYFLGMTIWETHALMNKKQ